VKKTYEIGPFLLDSAAGILSHAGKPTLLGPRAIPVLSTLVERANEYAPKAPLWATTRLVRWCCSIRAVVTRRHAPPRATADAQGACADVEKRASSAVGK